MSEVYLVGAGSIGGLIATQFSKVSKSPITLLLNSEERIRNFLNHNSTIRYKNLVHLRNPIIQDFKFKAVSNTPTLYTGKPMPIHNLIVTTKSHQTLDAVSKLIPCLSKNSNVLFIQNGLGVVDLVRKTFYANDELNQPNFYQGVISHGVFKRNSYEINHVGLGDLKIAKIPPSGQLDSNSQEGVQPLQMVLDLMGSDILNTQLLPYNEFLLFQYEKLIVNACINPLTAVLDSTNGELLRLFQTRTIFNGIIREAVQVILATVPEDFKADPTLFRVLDHNRLVSVVLNVAKATSYNSSSMREDVRHLQKTEVDFINGYIFKKAQEKGIFTPYNKMIVDLVKLKLQLNMNRNDQAIKLSL